MGAQSAPQVDRLAHVERAAGGVLQHVDARRAGRVAANAVACLTPRLATILENERLRDEPAREVRRRAADAEHFGRDALMVRLIAHFGEARTESVAKQG